MSQLKPGVVLVTTTFSPNADDLRFRLALDTCREAARCGYQLVIVDDSPPEEAKGLLEAAGATVFKQTEKGMGGSRRQVLREALARGAETIVWLEPEKAPLVGLLGPCIDMVSSSGYDLVIPMRRTLESLPTYQQRSEYWANLLLAHVTKRYDLDLMFGPRVMSREAAELFLSYDGSAGDLWHILFLPVLRALAAGMNIGKVVVEYVHPPEQTAAEEGNEAMDAKRDQQRVAIVAAVQQEAVRLGLAAA